MDQPTPPKQGFFSQKAPPAGPPVDMMESISGIQRRLKLLENTVSNMKGSFLTIERNQIEFSKDVRVDIKTLESDYDEVKTSIHEIKNTLKMMITELQGTARGEDVKVLQKYLNLWSPVNFVTPAQVKKIVQETLEEMKYD